MERPVRRLVCKFGGCLGIAGCLLSRLGKPRSCDQHLGCTKREAAPGAVATSATAIMEPEPMQKIRIRTKAYATPMYANCKSCLARFFKKGRIVLTPLSNLAAVVIPQSNHLFLFIIWTVKDGYWDLINEVLLGIDQLSSFCRHFRVQNSCSETHCSLDLIQPPDTQWTVRSPESGLPYLQVPGSASCRVMRSPEQITPIEVVDKCC